MEKKTKFILIGLGVVVVGTGAYVYSQIIKKNQNNAKKKFEDALKANSAVLPITPSVSPSPKPSSSGASSSGFPLKSGSKGTLVKSLQNALIKKYGAKILPEFGADGDFGSETRNALVSKGYPTSIDEDTFTKIVLSAGIKSTNVSSGSGVKPSNSTLSYHIHQAIEDNNFSYATKYLKFIKSVSQYSAVNTIFKKKDIGWVSKTIVTALLDQFESASERKTLNEHFYRIGLKYDGSKWSLSGLSGQIDRLVTIRATRVWDQSGQAIQVPKATILGEYLDANDGVTEFETLDGRRLFVATQSISYSA